MAFAKGNKLQQKYSDDFINKIIEEYLDGSTAVELGIKYNIKPATINYHLRKRGLSRGSGKPSSIANKNYFEVIDTEEKAYFLGFLMADGCISSSHVNYHIKLELQEKDSDIIKALLLAIGSKNTISKVRKGNYIGNSVSLSCKKMFYDLVNHGFLEHKSGNELIPNTIPDELVHHFIRGYFDGDGCASKEGRISIVGGMRILKDIAKCAGIDDYIIYEFKSTSVVYDLRYSKLLNSKLFYNYLYKDANIFLYRKWIRLFNAHGPIEKKGRLK